MRYPNIHFIRYWVPAIVIGCIISLSSAIPFGFIQTLKDSAENHDKLAHMIVYAIFAVFIRRVVVNSVKRSVVKYAEIITLIAIFMFGCMDELYQYQNPGRTMSLGDLGADVAGAAIALVIAKLYFWNRELKIIKQAEMIGNNNRWEDDKC